MVPCHFCKQDGDKCCTRCKSVFYCSKACRRSDWRNHKPNCHFMASDANISARNQIDGE